MKRWAVRWARTVGVTPPHVTRAGPGVPLVHTYLIIPMKTGSDLIAEAKTRIRQVTVAEVQQALAGAAAPLVIDCREPQETNLGRIPGAVVIPRGVLETKIEAVAPRDADIVLYCASGNRSALAADTMQQMGYTRVASMAGGFGGWAAAGGPVEG